MSSSNATLKDVARLAGVSTATVARVIHNNGYVADETRKAVEAAIAESRYQLNGLAQGLRKRRTFSIGHVLGSIWPNPFFASVAMGVEAEANRLGCGVLIANTQGSVEGERKAVEMLIRRRVDAILFTTCANSDNLLMAMNQGIPVTQIERSTEVDTDSVTVDNLTGSADATRHLIEHGHRRIAFLGVAPGRASNSHAQAMDALVERERLEGYQETLAAHGIAQDPDLLDLDESYYDLNRARSVTERWLQLPTHRRPTAIFAACDVLAAGVLQQLYASGLRVPEDMSVIGFDDTDAQYLTPPLTTVAQPMSDLGSSAARLALQRLDAEGAVGPPWKHVRLSTRLVVRASTGPASV